MDDLTLFLQKSANLYKFLSTVPEEDRDTYISDVNQLLDEREEIVQRLKQANFEYDKNNKQHVMLYELDLGIKERLQNILDDIKNDLKDLQVLKKKELKYINPYQDLYNRNGRYYDGRK